MMWTFPIDSRTTVDKAYSEVSVTASITLPVQKRHRVSPLNKYCPVHELAPSGWVSPLNTPRFYGRSGIPVVWIVVLSYTPIDTYISAHSKCSQGVRRSLCKTEIPSCLRAPSLCIPGDDTPREVTRRLIRGFVITGPEPFPLPALALLLRLETRPTLYSHLSNVHLRYQAVVEGPHQPHGLSIAYVHPHLKRMPVTSSEHQ
jgi:hypothetical protein